MESIHTSESFQQRRKRSESTGGFKSNISRMVRKSSSNFLKKLVKSFDDRDAPPIPNLADHHTSPLASPCDESHPMRGKPQLPDLEPQHSGHLIAPPPLSPLFGKDVTRYSAGEPASPVDIGVNAAYPSAGSNVESWLKQNAESGGIRPPAVGHCGDHGDDDYEEELDEEEDEDVPAVITNRLSKLYESGSLHLSNQSQTSLYYSTKSTFSENEGTESIAASSPKRASFIVQEALGYSLGLSRGSSGRLSQYSIGSSNGGYATLPHLRPSSSSSMPSSPGLGKVFFEPEGRPSISRRPVSMFTPTRSSLAIEDSRQDEEDQEGSKGKDENIDPPTVLTTESAEQTPELTEIVTNMPTVTPRRPSPTQRTASNAGELGSGGLSLPAARPITICVSAEALKRYSGNAGSSGGHISGDTREPSETLAIRTARQCYDEDETFLRRDEISEYLGTPKAFHHLVLTHYMGYFDFSGMRLDVAFRTLCQRLALKGETQEVDRILVVFAQRYVDCNPYSLLGGATNSKDVVHAITYSILLLNTDLHVVQQSTRMSKSAFVKNTLQVVGDQISQPTPIDPNPPQLDRPSFLGDENSWLSHPSGFSLPGDDISIASTTTTPTTATPKKRTPSVRSWKSSHSHQPGLFNSSRVTPDSKTGGRYGKAWLQELEIMLKDIYSAVKSNQILLPTSGGAGSNSISSPPMSPTTTSGGFGSSFFSSNRISRLIQPSAFSSAPASSASSQHHVYESGSGSGLLSGGGFGMGLSGRRNSLSARSRQRRNEAIQRLNAQQQQLTIPGVYQHDNSSLLSTSPLTSHFPNPRYSIAGSILNEASAIDITNQPGFPSEERGSGGNSSSTRLASGNAGGGYLGSAGRLSNLTLATTTSMTTPSASQNSLTSLQSPASSVISEEYQSQQHRKKSGSIRPMPPPSPVVPYVTMPPLHPDPQVQQIQVQRYQCNYQQRYRLEGILWRKHLLERHDKKAQNRAWRHLLVVVDQERGSLIMFRADQSLGQSKGLGHSYGQGQHLPIPLGSASTLSLNSALSPTFESYPASNMTLGGSYLDQGAPLFDEIPLQHTITNILPAPGYSASRKHVFAVQSFTGGVYLFQTTTPQECEVWARTCNFWAARTSKEPLMGGVVNMEYGWGRTLETLHQFEQEQELLQQQHQQQLLEASLDTAAPSSKSSQSSGHSIQGPRGRSQTAGANASQLSHTTGPVPPMPGPFHGGGFSHNMSQDNISVLSGRGGPLNTGKGTSVRSSARAASFSGAGSMAGGGSSPLPSPSVSSSSISTASTILASNAVGGSAAGSGTLATAQALGEQVTLFEWTAPNPAMTLTVLTVEDQLQALKKYVTSLECEMETHQGHRGPMMRLFHPKSSNYTKAFNNWERRSGHMLKEMVKYQIYVECLGQDLQFWQELQTELEIELGIQFQDDAQASEEGAAEEEQQQQQSCPESEATTLSVPGCDSSEKAPESMFAREIRVDLEAELADLNVHDEPALLLMRER
ncbi:hypothetical protein BGW38_009788 [Lunasporangiospora selenospora]|uniref:SEC7 domain-containing protein n=1 Tax=Lunasporangiospora selenospora TaxID=979761 RepID=A0A9P6FY76_9FUNG|nr:hypothetical protein BGW38_009788 [Lunasporangiospora selenospora]